MIEKLIIWTPDPPEDSAFDQDEEDTNNENEIEDE